MEVEKEKKDKLAAARKKLNEYKQNRGTGKPATAPNASSKPADVPQFYQNLNSPPLSTFNIFNPAASVDNNNVISSYFGQHQEVQSPAVVPFVSDILKTDTSEPNQYILNNNQTPSHEQQILHSPLPAGISSLINLIPEPTSSVVPVPNQQPTDDTQFRQELPRDSLHSELIYSSSTSSFLQPVFSDLGLTTHLGREETNEVRPSDPSNQASEVFPTPELDVTNIQNEHIPSAPPLDNSGEPKFPFTTSDQFVENADLFSKENQNEDIHKESERVIQAEEKDKKVADSSTQLFASSLFTTFADGQSKDVYDTIFKLDENQTPELPSEIQHLKDETVGAKGEEESSILPANALFQQVMAPVVEGQFSEDITPLPLRSYAESVDIPVSTDLIGESTTFSPIMESGQDDPFKEGMCQESTSKEVTNEVLTHENNSETLFETSLPEVFMNPIVQNNKTSMNQHFIQDENITTGNVSEQNEYSNETINHMKSLQEALELQMEELRRENDYLLERQIELTSKIEESEKLAHEFKLERDLNFSIKEETMRTVQALRAKINSLCEENQRIVKNSTEVGVDLRAVMEEKTKQLEEMQNAFIVVSQSKMDFAGKLDHQLEVVKNLENLVLEKDAEIDNLRSENSIMKEKLKEIEHKDITIQQLNDRVGHCHIHNERLQTEVSSLRWKINELNQRQQPEGLHQVQEGVKNDGSFQNSDLQHLNEAISSLEDQKMTFEDNPGVHNQHEHHSEICDHDHHHSHSNSEAEHHHHTHDEADHSAHYHHSHDDHTHHDHSHHDHHHHEHVDEAVEVVARRGPSDEMTELKKTLHRLQWENSNFRNEIDVLAVNAKEKQAYETKCIAIEEENAQLKDEIGRLEHVIIQLQGENDTIGDYITLYQTQKMALKECAKEKDAQLELLAREREMLLHRLAELTALVKDLKESKSEAGSQCADDHTHTMHNLDSSISLPPPPIGNKRQIEGKIRDLLTEISSSTLIENFHPCAVCSGRLMTV